MSMSATGKLADAIVFFGWKGINVVRQWLVPQNPQSAAQGDIRLIIGGLGKCIGKNEAGSPFDLKLTALGVIPAQQTRQSYLVKYIKDNILTGQGATMTGNYNNELAALTGHTAYTAFATAANTLALADFDLSYASIAPFEKELGVYLIARAAIALGFTGEPYTSALTSWTGADLDKLVNHLTA